MSAKSIKKAKKKTPQLPTLSLGKTNYLIFGIAVVCLVVGYVFMSIGPAESFWSLTASPIILVFAYCVVIPLAIFWRPKKDTGETAG